MARPGSARHGQARHGKELGRAGQGGAWRGAARQCKARNFGLAWRGSAEQGAVGRGKAGIRVWRGSARRGGVVLGEARNTGAVRLGEVWLCGAWHGAARQGEARFCKARIKARQCFSRPGQSGQGKARRGYARRSKARNVARLGLARSGEAVRGGAGTGEELGLKHKNRSIHMDTHKTYKVVLTGESPLIMHKDNIEWSEKIKDWQKDPAHKADSQAGDDRSPAWTWIGSLYCDPHNTNIYMDSDNLMTMLREGGAKVPTGKRSATYKAATQSGLLISTLGSPFFVNGKQIPKNEILALEGERDFKKHQELALSLGFELLVKRAKIGMSKHIRVRPMFRNWKVETSIEVFDEGKSGITKEVLQRILDEAGALCGLGDWRPSSRTPGKFGRFKAEII